MATVRPTCFEKLTHSFGEFANQLKQVQDGTLSQLGIVSALCKPPFGGFRSGGVIASVKHPGVEYEAC